MDSYCDPTRSSATAKKRQTPTNAGIRISRSAIKAFAGLVLLAGHLPVQQRLNAAAVLPGFNIQAQTACETEMLQQMGAREVVSGKGYDVL